ncbi:MAG: hypothetical protein ACR2QF_07465, partial [Geminicoccaceae bacterium]
MGPTEWLAWLHRYTERHVQLRRFHNTDKNVPARSIWTRDPDDVDGFVRKFDIPGHGTFFGVATRKNRQGDVNACLEVPAVWIDCDGHWPIHEMQSCPMPPSAIVESGGGIHAYWVLSEPYDVTDVCLGRHRDHPIMRVLTALKRVFNGDPQVVDIARVMRLPGTTNSKRDEHIVCHVLEHNSLEYHFDDLDDWLSWQRELVGEPVDPFVAAMDDLGIKPPLDVQEMLDGMVYGENVHDVQVRVTASLQGAGVPEDQIVEKVVSATRLAVGQQGVRWDWKRETANVRDMIRTARQKFGAAQPKVVNISDERDKRASVDDIVSGKKKSDDDIPVFVKAGMIALRARDDPLISTSGEFWRYGQGIWQRFGPADEAELQSSLQKTLTLIKASPSVTNK